MLCLAAASLVVMGCEFLSEKFGIDEVTRFAVDAEIPVTIRLPPRDLPGSPEAYSQALRVAIQVDVLQSLRDKGRDDDADLIEANYGKIDQVILHEVEYEIPDPNNVGADIAPLVVFFGPHGTEEPGVSARELGRTVEVPAFEPIARREMEYAATGLADASKIVGALKFAVLLDTEVGVPRDVAVPRDALVVKLRLHVTIEADIAG